MVYNANAMLPVEIDTPTWRRDNFMEEGKFHTHDQTDSHLFSGPRPHPF